MQTPTTAARPAEPTPTAAATSAPSDGQVAPARDLTWVIQEVDRGVKPALALNSQGTPVIVYMLESTSGFVKSAERNGSGWDIATVASGYFYGPLDVAIGPDDVAHVSYHDHQDLRGFRPEKGDAAYAVLRNGDWTTEPIFDEGHDGWDNRIAIDAQGRPHISAIDPVEFGGDGLEYYRMEPNGDWTVEQVGSGPLTYKYATSIAIDPDGNPHITYFGQDESDLVLASRGQDGWTLERVDTEGESGLFSSLVIDEAGRFHVSYLQRISPSRAVVKYATRAAGDAQWELRTVGRLDAMRFGFTGARNSTSLALDGQGNPWIAYSDEAVMMLARWDGTGWQTSTVAEAGARPFGQQVSLKLDAADVPHIAFFEVTNTAQLDGVVKYALGQR